MREEHILALQKLNIMRASGREWRERIHEKFVAWAKGNFGEKAATIIGWYAGNLLQRLAWEQKRREELEMILAKNHPELLTPAAPLPPQSQLPENCIKKVA